MTAWRDDWRGRLSRESGTVFKDWGGRIPIALVYPNTYHVGMSSLGFQTLYAILNAHDSIVCERFFWERRAGEPLSLESQRPLSDFAVLAFSISYELDYFNVVAILKAAGLPLLAADRSDPHPLLLAGGPCITANPQPLAPFFDCFGIGEAEALLPSLLDVVEDGLHGTRDSLLRALASLPGIYVPLLHSTAAVTRQWMPSIDAFATTSAVLTPDTELGRMFLVEVTRGCRWGCRFCLAGYLFRPFRYRSLDNLLLQAEEGLRREKTIGLLGASPADHPQIDELASRLRRMGATISTSSLRIRPMSPVLLRESAESGARSIALAPEAGSQRLRSVINKGITDSDIIAAVDAAAHHPFKHLRLYFMIGLPTETDEDVEQAARLVLSLKECVDRRQPALRISLTVEPFVPKAGTPFQWLPMASAETLQHRLSLLRNSLRPKGIEASSESVNWMIVQGVLSKGDARLADVLAETNGRSLSSWRRAMERFSLESEYYVNRPIPLDERLPWSNLDSGVTDAFLRREYERAHRAEGTPPCPAVGCHDCGVC
ncbi:MAG: radical SAM protein [Chloroflexota bacterium]|nr:radical SAM protein [Chloroflexota bacterium]